MVLVFPYLGLIDLGSIGKPVLPQIGMVDNEKSLILYRDTTKRELKCEQA